MSASPKSRELSGRYGGHKSWANTADRSQRTEPGRRAGPGSIDYWLSRLDPIAFANARDDQRVAAAQSMRKAHFVRLSMLSVKARTRGRGDAA